ncbi:MAG: LysE family translocator [Hyphomonadaceae bacterium]|nr:LysE family translocator [Hyphomonadaceae bacterium]
MGDIVDHTRFVAFLGVMAALAATPGPANVFAIATGVQRGPMAALRAVLGMNLATLAWFTLAALGLAALIQSFPAVFKIAAWLGGAYVAWLGLKALWSALQERPALHIEGTEASASALRQGFLVQFSNPKLVVFFSAVLPPFLDPARPLAPQLAVFAAVVVGMDVAAMSAYGLLGGGFAHRLTEGAAARWFSAGVGVLLLLAAYLILKR